MSRVYLLNPPGDIIRTGRWVRKSRGNQSWAPIWLAYSCAVLEREGHECKLVDASVNGKTPLEITSDVREFSPNTIAYYWAYDTAEDDLHFANELAKKYSLVLVGPWSHCLPDALSRTKNVELMTYGEFDHTLLEIVEVRSPEHIEGLIWKSPDGTITRNDRRPLCSSEELDKIPFVTDVYKRFLDLYKYRQTSFRYPFVDLLSARGCTHRCVESDTLVKMWDKTKKEIDSICAGDYVFTQAGKGRVVEKREYNEVTMRIELVNGDSISVTADHRFRTKRGWVRAENLRNSDEVMCIE